MKFTPDKFEGCAGCGHLTPALQEDRNELVESAQKLWSMGVRLNTANEYLGLGLPTVGGGAVGYLPFNLAPVGSGAPVPKKSAVVFKGCRPGGKNQE